VFETAYQIAGISGGAGFGPPVSEHGGNMTDVNGIPTPGAGAHTARAASQRDLGGMETAHWHPRQGEPASGPGPPTAPQAHPRCPPRPQPPRPRQHDADPRRFAKVSGHRLCEYSVESRPFCFDQCVHCWEYIGTTAHRPIRARCMRGPPSARAR
jgi:hypothetical protein